MKSLNRMETTGKTARGCWEELKASVNNVNDAISKAKEDGMDLMQLLTTQQRQLTQMVTCLEKVVQYSEPENNTL